MKQKVAKKNGKSKKATKKSEKPTREELIEQFTKMGPFKVKKYATAVMGESASEVDTWNDFDYMVDFCVAKSLGEEPPKRPDSTSDQYDDEDNDNEDETETEDSDDDDNEEESNESSEENSDEEDDDDMFASQMEDGGCNLFNNTSDDDEETEEPEPKPKKKSKLASKVEKGKSSKKKKKVEVEEEEEVPNNAFQDLLDVVTNQGVVIDELGKTIKTLNAKVNELCAMQEASHKALVLITKTCFAISSYTSHFVPKALRAMNFKVTLIKEIRAKAEESSKQAEELMSGILDTESD